MHVNSGDYMKKIFLVLFLIIFFGIRNVKSINYDYLINDESYDLHTISIENLTTKNFIDFLSNINVVGLYPSINPIYKDKIGNLYYKFNSSNNRFEIDSFIQSYLSLIKKNSYSDYNYLYTNGIGIDKIDVYMSGSELYNFILSNKNLLINIIK